MKNERQHVEPKLASEPKAMMHARDAAAIYKSLERAGIEAWVDGGWGVDALLEEQTRPHDDIDLIVRVDDVPHMRALLAEQGFQMVEGDPKSNFVLRDSRGRKVDVHTVRFDEEGTGIYRKLNGEDWFIPPPASRVSDGSVIERFTASRRRYRSSVTRVGMNPTRRTSGTCPHSGNDSESSFRPG